MDVRVQRASGALASQYELRLQSSLDELRKLLFSVRANPVASDQRAAIEQIAHRIHGTAGTYGFHPQSDLAQSIERAFEADSSLPDANWFDRTLNKPAWQLPVAKPDGLSADGPERPINPQLAPRILVVDDDESFIASLRELGARKLVQVSGASDIESATTLAKEGSFQGVIVDCHLAGTQGTEVALQLRELPEFRDVPFAFVSVDTSVQTRINAAHAGGMYFLEKPVREGAFNDLIHRLTAHSEQDKPSILVVDDDPDIFGQLSVWLHEHGWKSHYESTPARVLDALGETSPDLVLMDFNMPGMSGADCCQLIRTSSLWGDTPVIFLTAATDTETRLASFRAGADDYVSKPVIKEELVARVMSRLDRLQLMKRQAQRDTLTGLFNRAIFAERLETRLYESLRSLNPVALCVVDIDHFKRVNDEHGHLAGDEVLRTMGQKLQSRFRTEDLRCRWGGEEFALALFGESSELAAQIVRRVLAEFSEIDFQTSDGQSFRVTFSAGVAQFPDDGSSLEEIFAVADARLYMAKEAGRNRVVASTIAIDKRRVKLLIVDDEEDNRALLRRTFAKDYDILEASNGEMGLEIARSERPDMVITDQRMAKMKGTAMLARIRDELPGTGRILVTAYGNDENLSRAINDAGVHRYIAKPIVPVDLRGALEALTQSADLERELESSRRAKRTGDSFRRRIISALDEAILVFDMKSQVAEVNSKAEELFATSRSELLGTRLTSLVKARTAEWIRAGLAQNRGEHLRVQEGHLCNDIIAQTTLVPAPPTHDAAFLLVFRELDKLGETTMNNISKVLLVDDEEDIRTVAKLSLENVGQWHVEAATSGPEAIELVQRIQPDVILLDMMMPGMDGMTTLSELRSLGNRTPIIFMTAKTQRSEIDAYLKAGAIGVIKKPFDPMQLPAQIKQVFTEKVREIT